LVSALAAACLVALSSCATTDARAPLKNAVAAPAAWQQGKATFSPLDTAALPDWWTRFKDPVLDELITDARRSSPDVRSALSRIAEYRARRGIERSSLFPSLDANVSGGRTRSTNRDTNLTTTSESYAASLAASWQVDSRGQPVSKTAPRVRILGTGKSRRRVQIRWPFAGRNLVTSRNFDLQISQDKSANRPSSRLGVKLAPRVAPDVAHPNSPVRSIVPVLSLSCRDSSTVVPKLPKERLSLGRTTSLGCN